jgi:Flp pilus assembly protein TadD
VTSVGSQPAFVTPELALELDRLGLTFLAEILEAEVERHPDNIDALAELGHVYTRQGRMEKGLCVDRRLVRLSPGNPTAHYNLACSLALTGELGAAIDALELAIEHGYDDPEFMSQDDDLASLRQDARFQALLQRLRERALGGPIP